MNKKLVFSIALGMVIGQAGASERSFDRRAGRILTESPSKAQITVRGVVRDANGPIAGATVSLVGTSVSAQTDDRGAYSISASIGDHLRFASIGHEAQERQVATATLDVTLGAAAAELDEVIVTALGIKRDKKALGYTVAELKGEEIAQGKETNLANALSGKVAGVQVSRTASGAGGAAKVVIRGNNSLQGNSQPLYVVDGVPIDNANHSAPSNWGGTDYGDGIGNINPDDIETMSVLKGPNAAALYGQRGSNGVILITTKSGSAGRTAIHYGTDYAIGNALVLPDFQNEYGQGLNGTFTHFRKTDGTIVSMADAIANDFDGMPKMSAGRDRNTRASWGPRMEGQTYEDQYGHVLSLTPKPDTYGSFFQTEKQAMNNLSLDGGNDRSNYRFSFANTHTNGYVPANTLNRNNFGLRSQSKIADGITVDVKANYILQNAENRPKLADDATNPAYLFISQPRSLGNDILAQHKWTAEEVSRQLGFSSSTVREGLEKTYATNGSTANPWWTAIENHQEDRRDRIIGLLRLSYHVAPWLKLTATGGTDFYTDQRFAYRPIDTYPSPGRRGDMSEEVIRSRENNYDVLAVSNFDLSDRVKLNLNLGGSHQSRYLRSNGQSGKRFIVPKLFTINNLEEVDKPLFTLAESQINSAYFSGQFAYGDYWFVDFSGRNDWSSTLAPENNSFFYPSVSTSLVLSDAFKWRSDLLPFLKVRGSWAQAGSSGSPYQLTGEYGLGESYWGAPTASFTGTIPDQNLKNELTTSVEVGADMNFLRNRLSLSFTYYDASTKNQILTVPIAPSSLYSSIRINAGEIENKGFEFSLGGTPVRTASGFEWNALFNFNRNRNMVKSLHPGIESLQLGFDRGVRVRADVGKPFGQVIGWHLAWIKDEAGNRLIDPDTGLPLRTANPTQTDLGNAQPDWIGGFGNTFRYKGISLHALVDIRQGGIIYSQSNREQIIYGTTKKTLAGRDGTYVADGYVAAKDGNGNWVNSGVRNTKQVAAQDYWNVVAGDKGNENSGPVVSEEMVNDMSYIAMREINLSYQLPLRIRAVRGAKVGVYGRNLFYFQRKTDGFSPESAAFNVHNSGIGIESTSLPMMRNFGINLSIGF